MAIPRPVLLALLGLVLCAAAFVATRGASDTAGTVSSTPVTVAAAPRHAAKKQAVAKPAVTAHPAAKTHDKAVAAPKAPAKPKVVSKPAPVTLTPAQVEAAKLAGVVTAINRGDVVVFLFTGPGAADDTSTRAAVESLRGTKGVTVVEAGLKELFVFRPILAEAGVTQTPAVVIAKAHKDARLIEGYVDAQTLRQSVADARR